MIPAWVPPGRIVRLGGRDETFARVTTSDGTPVLLLHGWMATADVNWYPVYRALDGRRGLIAPDLRGHGRSAISEERVTIPAMVDDLVALLDELSLDRVLVAGYSMGGAVAQQLAARQPTRVAGLLLSGTALRWTSPSQWILLRRAGWDGTVQRASTGRFFGRRLAQRAARTSPAAAEVADWIVAELERGHPGNLRDAGRSLARHDGRPLLDVLRDIPATVVLTSGDHLVPARRQRELADAIGARVVEVGGDHDTPAAHGEIWSAVVADELDRLDPSAELPAA